MLIEVKIYADPQDLPALAKAMDVLRENVRYATPSNCSMEPAASNAVDVEILEHDARVEAAEEAEATVVEEGTPEPAAPDESAVVAALREYATAHGLPAATELLARFDAKRVSDIAIERRSEFIRATQLWAA